MKLVSIRQMQKWVRLIHRLASDLEKPGCKRRRARGGKKTTATATPPTTTEDAAPKTGRTARKTHDEVVAENNEKMADYMAERDKAVDAIANGREEPV